MADTYTLVNTIDEDDSIGGRKARILHIWLLAETPTGNQMAWITDANGDKIAAQSWSPSFVRDGWGDQILADMDQDGQTPDIDLVPLVDSGDAMAWSGDVIIRYGETQADALTRINAETLPAIRTAVHDELQTQNAQKNREVYG